MGEFLPAILERTTIVVKSFEMQDHLLTVYHSTEEDRLLAQELIENNGLRALANYSTPTVTKATLKPSTDRTRLISELEHYSFEERKGN